MRKRTIDYTGSDIAINLVLNPQNMNTQLLFVTILNY